LIADATLGVSTKFKYKLIKKYITKTFYYRIDIQMKPDVEKEVSNQIYDKYVDLYIHLDNLRWNIILAILILFYSVFNVLDSLFENSEYFQFSIGIGFIVMSGIIYFISKVLKKFVSGQDFICGLLANFENCAFDNSNEELNNKISFFERRRRSIEKKKSSEIPENKTSISKKLNRLFKKETYRSSVVMDNLLSKGSLILFLIGIIYIFTDLINISVSKMQMLFISLIGFFLLFLA
jgi:hypothetical protein